MLIICFGCCIIVKNSDITEVTNVHKFKPAKFSKYQSCNRSAIILFDQRRTRLSRLNGCHAKFRPISSATFDTNVRIRIA